MPESQDASVEEAITSDEMACLIDLLNARRFADGESQARSLLASYPKCSFTWEALGIALWMQGKDSRSVLITARQLQPGDAEAHSNLGHVLLEFDQPLEAAQSCQRALTLDPRLADAHGNLGNAPPDICWRFPMRRWLQIRSGGSGA
jgi:tetratricopeptide (TPR) repeat protein